MSLYEMKAKLKKIMNTKKYFLAAIVLNTAVLAFAACFYDSSQTQCGGPSTALSGAPGKFGPVVDVVLPATTSDKHANILDFETGRILAQPPFEKFETPANVITT